MKSKLLYFHYITLFIICQALAVFPVSATSSTYYTESENTVETSEKNYSTDVIYKDFIVDYFLIKAEDGSSRLHIHETITGIFPEKDLKHGPTRRLPSKNLNGKNYIAPTTSSLNMRVTRNGVSEPIAKVETTSADYTYYIGDADIFINGPQTYTFDYDYINAVASFDIANSLTTDSVAYQQIYWDTNGTGWNYSFDKLTARIHLDEKINSTVLGNKTSCYVGKYNTGNDNTNISSRCQYKTETQALDTDFYPSDFDATNETIHIFETDNLAPYENLTFAIDFKPSAGFIVIEIKESNAHIIAMAIVTILMIFFCIKIAIAKFKGAFKSTKFLKNTFIKPEYQPPANLSIAESAILYDKENHQPSYIATLIELVVTHKITIKKTDEGGLLKKRKWEIEIKKHDFTSSEESLLRILAGEAGHQLAVGDKIIIKKHTPTRKLEKLGEAYTEDAEKALCRNGYLNKPHVISRVKGVKWFILGFFSEMFVGMGCGFYVVLSGATNDAYDAYCEHIANILIMFIFFFIIISILPIGDRRDFAQKGLHTLAHLAGLKEYIKLAEADRIKFLQSVDGVDTSSDGIYKLNERLLPYAILFKMEDSWMKELSKYPEYSTTFSDSADGLNAYTIAALTTSINSNINHSTHVPSSSSSGGGGSWSSSSSGSSGGGFSGGGGGGGGGGSW